MMSKLKHIYTLSTPADVEKRRFNVRLQLWVDLVCLMSTDEMSLQQYFYKKWTSCMDCHVAYHFFSSCRCKFSSHIYLQMWSSGDKSGWYVSYKVTLTINVASTFEIVDALSLKKSDDLATLLNSLKEILC